MILHPYSIEDRYGTVTVIGSTDSTLNWESTDYNAKFPRAAANLQMETNASYIKRAGAVPVYSGKDYKPHTMVLEIICKHDTQTLFSTLNQLFDTKDETPRQLICIDVENSDKQYYIYVTPTKVLGGHDGTMVTVTLAIDDPVWQSVSYNSQTFGIATATDSTSVTVNGNDESYPIFEVTPTSQTSTDYRYSVYLQVLPTSTDPWNNRRINITGDTSTTWDTAALVTAVKMQADMDDFAVLQDGVFVDFWLSGANTTDTKVNVVADMPPVYNMTLGTALASTDTITTVSLTVNNANKKAIKQLPNEGRIIIDTSLGSTDSEEFVYTAKTVTTTELSFTINSRAVRGTVALNHSVGHNVRFLPYDFTLVYGKASATAPEIDDTYKPISSLADNNSTFTYTQFYNVAATRAGIWKPEVTRVSNPQLTNSGYYTSTNDAGDTDPASAMGVRAESYESNGVWNADTITILWKNYFPEIVSSVSASGYQIQTVAGRPSFKLQSSPDDQTWATLATVAAQSATDYSTWTAWTISSSDLTIPTGTTYLRFIQNGSITGSTDNYARVSVEAVTVAITNNPHVMIRAEAANVQANFKIVNSTTGDYFIINFPMATSETLYIDTNPDFPTVTYKGKVVNGCIKLSTVRSKWLVLRPGTNTIGFETQKSDVDPMNIVIKFKDRANFF